MECAGGACSASSFGFIQCSGQCAAYAAEGQECNQTFCAPGLACNFETGSLPSAPICVIPSDAGSGCPCKPGLYCDYGDAPDATPTCQELKKGGFCDGPWECALGHTCRGYPSECLPLVGVGSPCGASAVCGWGLFCDSQTSRCAALPTIGESCVLSRDGTTADLQCFGVAWCDKDDTKKCRAPKADGEPCQYSQPGWYSQLECLGYCDDTQHCTGSASQPVCTPP